MKKSVHQAASGSAPASDVKGTKKKATEASDPNTRLPKRTRDDIHSEVPRRSTSPLPVVEETPAAERRSGKAPVVTDLTFDTKWYNGNCNPGISLLWGNEFNPGPLIDGQVLKPSDARLLLEQGPDESMEAAAAYALRIASITRFWSHHLSDNVKKMEMMRDDAARALRVKDELAQAATKCEEQARTVGQLKAQKAELDKHKVSLQSELDREKEEKAGLQKAVEDSRASCAQLQQSLEAERVVKQKLEADLDEAVSNIVKEHVNGFSRTVKQLQRFNPDADFSRADVDNDFNQDGVMVPLSELEDEEEIQEEGGIEEQAAEEGGNSEEGTVLPDPALTIPPPIEDALYSVPVETVAPGDV